MTTSDLAVALDEIFNRPVRSLRRTRSPYSSSFIIEDLELKFENGDAVNAVFKNLSPDAMLEGARVAKPAYLYVPDREIQVYRSILSSGDLGTPRMFGATVDPALKRYWLFLERIDGEALFEIGEFEIWLQVAKWLGVLHASCSSDAARAAAPQLLECNPDYYRSWLERATESAGSTLDHIATRYDRVIEVLLTLPCTFIHGEFYPSNILVQRRKGEARVCPVDWEMAATGPGLLDAAALASGKWSRQDRLTIAEAYHSSLPRRLQSDQFLTAFDCCQLNVALQWIGWSRSWSPPEAHAHDWLGEALRLSKESSLAALFG